MTPIVLPLVLSLASFGIVESRLVPAVDQPASKIDVRYLSTEGLFDAASFGSAEGKLWSSSSYPEAYRWTGRDGIAEPGEYDGAISRAGLVTGDGNVLLGLDSPDDYSDNDFRWTRRVGGGVGVGFIWRYR